jgi:phosphate:Na+ symporter
MEAYKHVGETIHFASKVFMEKEISDAHDLLHRKETFRNLELESIENHLSRLANRDPGAIATTAYHADILQDLKRINSLFISCAYPLLEDAGRLHPSRLKKM